MTALLRGAVPAEPPPPSDGRTFLIAVVTAAATTVVTALATWAVDELRARYGTKPVKPETVPTPREEVP